MLTLLSQYPIHHPVPDHEHSAGEGIFEYRWGGTGISGPVFRISGRRDGHFRGHVLHRLDTVNGLETAGAFAMRL